MPKTQKLPTITEFLEMKSKISTVEPPWIFLEREMIEMAEKGKKPYNKIVGDWLLFLKDLKEHYQQERKRVFEQLKQAVGPPWFCLLSPTQQKALSVIHPAIRFDFYYKTYIHTYAILRKMGITTNYPFTTVLTAIKNSGEDPGLFLWNLFTLHYKQPPSEPLPRYSLNAKIVMTALVFVDMAECLKELHKLTNQLVYPPKPPPKTIKFDHIHYSLHGPAGETFLQQAHAYRNISPDRSNIMDSILWDFITLIIEVPKDYVPDIKFGVYLSKMYAPTAWNAEDTSNKKPYLNYKVKYWTNEEYEELAQRTLTISMQTRRYRVKLAKTIEDRQCHYKFWRSPTGFRADEPGMAEFQKAMLMLKTKPKPQHLKISNLDNLNCQIGTVAYSGGQPVYLLCNFVTRQLGYLIINGGCVKIGDSYVVQILGSIKYPKDVIDFCWSCDCIKKWDINHIKTHLALKAKCTCGHRFDFRNTDKVNPLQQYFHGPTKNAPYYLDYAMIFDPTSKTEFIKSIVEQALLSETPSMSTPQGFINPASLPTKVLVMSFLGDLMETSLLIPHLSKAFMLLNIQAWVRKQVKGSIGPKLKKNLALKTDRAWLNLKHLDFRVPCHKIPFTQKQLKEFNFAHRQFLQELKVKEFNTFVKTNNRLRMLESDLLWATFRTEDFASKSFLNTFFAYMPLKGNQTFYLSPFGCALPDKRGGKTCPLSS